MVCGDTCVCVSVCEKVRVHIHTCMCSCVYVCACFSETELVENINSLLAELLCSKKIQYKNTFVCIDCMRVNKDIFVSVLSVIDL